MCHSASNGGYDTDSHSCGFLSLFYTDAKPPPPVKSTKLLNIPCKVFHSRDTLERDKILQNYTCIFFI